MPRRSDITPHSDITDTNCAVKQTHRTIYRVSNSCDLSGSCFTDSHVRYRLDSKVALQLPPMYHTDDGVGSYNGRRN